MVEKYHVCCQSPVARHQGHEFPCKVRRIDTTIVFICAQCQLSLRLCFTSTYDCLCRYLCSAYIRAGTGIQTYEHTHTHACTHREGLSKAGQYFSIAMEEINGQRTMDVEGLFDEKEHPKKKEPQTPASDVNLADMSGDDDHGMTSRDPSHSPFDRQSQQSGMDVKEKVSPLSSSFQIRKQFISNLRTVDEDASVQDDDIPDRQLDQEAGGE